MDIEATHWEIFSNATHELIKTFPVVNQKNKTLARFERNGERISFNHPNTTTVLMAGINPVRRVLPIFNNRVYRF